MEVTVKNIKTFRGHDGIGVNCDIYIDGKKVATMHDAAYGGSYEYQPAGNFAGLSNEQISARMSEYRENMRKLEAHAKEQLPEETFEVLDQFIDKLINEASEKQVDAKLAKKFDRILIFMHRDKTKYQQLFFGRGVKNAVLLSTVPADRLKAYVQRSKAELEPQGFTLINTNIDAEGNLIR